ncbi:MAG TPA: GTP cyclohydrolase I, partial [Dehalococcoidia bacterium]|nr:GTP cyclohydrolase I [Dehalococcoidia bacterium]
MEATITAGIDQERIKAAVREIIAAIGEDPAREGLLDTPRRIAQMYADLFSGLYEDPREVLTTGFQESHKEMVVLKNIPFYSLCEHHFLP